MALQSEHHERHALYYDLMKGTLNSGTYRTFEEDGLFSLSFRSDAGHYRIERTGLGKVECSALRENARPPEDVLEAVDKIMYLRETWGNTIPSSMGGEPELETYEMFAERARGIKSPPAPYCLATNALAVRIDGHDIQSGSAFLYLSEFNPESQEPIYSIDLEFDDYELNRTLTGELHAVLLELGTYAP